MCWRQVQPSQRMSLGQGKGKDLTPRMCIVTITPGRLSARVPPRVWE